MSNQPVTTALKHALADSFTLYVKTLNYHWNVSGPHFQSLHLLFETQYTDLALAIDEIAERIRSLGEKAPGSFAAYSKLTKIKEANDNTPDASTMVKELAGDQSVILDSLKNVLEEAQNAGDEVTVSLVTDRMTMHEKNRWMLQSSL